MTNNDIRIVCVRSGWFIGGWLHDSGKWKWCVHHAHISKNKATQCAEARQYSGDTSGRNAVAY